VLADLKIGLSSGPSGDKLSITSATPSLGFVSNRTEGFTAVVYGDKGLVKHRSGKSG
jgi:hypothetical protein